MQKRLFKIVEMNSAILSIASDNDPLWVGMETGAFLPHQHSNSGKFLLSAFHGFEALQALFASVKGVIEVGREDVAK